MPEAGREVNPMIRYLIAEVRDRIAWLIYRGWRDGTPCG